MSEILSQDQIDQLLSSGGLGSETAAAAAGAAGVSAGDRFPALDKTFELFCTQASTVLSTVLNKKAEVKCEASGKADIDTIMNALKDDHLCLSLPFKSGLTGELYLLIRKKDVAALGDLMLMGDGNAEYSVEHNDAIAEISNQIFSAFTLKLTSEIGSQVAAAPSAVTEYTVDKPPLPPEKLDMVFARLTIEGREESTLVLLLAEELSMQFAASIVQTAPAGADLTGGGADLMSTDFGAATTDTTSQFMQPAPSGPRDKSIEMLLDVDLDVSIELGRTNLTIKRILELAPGAIVELDRLAGEPVDLLVNNKVVAKGEVVVVDESFGIRILSLVSPEDRIKSLR